MTELTTQYTPAVITFDKDDFAKKINEVVKGYADLDVEDISVKDARAMRATLNKLTKQLEDERKSVKEAVTEPYKTFEDDYKEGVKPLNDLLAKFKQVIDGYDNQQKELRNSSVRNYLNIQADKHALDREVFDGYIKDFQKASDFKRDSFELTKKTMDKLNEIVEFELAKETSFEAETRYRTTVEFEMTVDQLKAFKQFLVEQRITFKTVEDAKEVTNG